MFCSGSRRHDLRWPVPTSAFCIDREYLARLIQERSTSHWPFPERLSERRPKSVSCGSWRAPHNLQSSDTLLEDALQHLRLATQREGILVARSCSPAAQSVVFPGTAYGFAKGEDVGGRHQDRLIL